MNIGIIGSGKIGSLVGKLWVEAGHQVRFSSRHPEQLMTLVRQLGERASAGSVEEAAAFGEVVLIAVPYGALPDLGRALGPTLAGKIVLETGNPYARRDGATAEEVVASGLGTGVWSARYLPGVRLVRAFNTVWDRTLADGAHRSGDRADRIGIPLASDDRGALETAARLVDDAGFDPVMVGPLERAKAFDVGTPVYNTGMSGAQVRRALGLAH